MLKKRIHSVIWIVLGGSIVFILVAAMNKKNGRVCNNITVKFTSGKKENFITEKEILSILKMNGAGVGKDVSLFPIETLEHELEKNKWISEADLFFDKSMTLHVRIKPPVPTARVFTRNGFSFYIDQDAELLPLSGSFSVRLPVITNIPDKNSNHFDSIVTDVAKLANYIQADSFWQHQVAQIDRNSNGNYEIVTVIGNQILKIGTTDNLDEKFSKLSLFYKDIWTKTGYEKYAVIDARFKEQLVATRRTNTQEPQSNAVSATAAENVVVAVPDPPKKEQHSKEKSTPVANRKEEPKRQEINQQKAIEKKATEDRKPKALMPAKDKK